MVDETPEEFNIRDKEIEYLKGIIVTLFDYMDKQENHSSNMRQQMKSVFQNSPMSIKKIEEQQSK